MVLLLVFLSIIAGLGAGLAIAFVVWRRQHVRLLATSDREAAAAASLQESAIQAAVAQVLAERGATASATAAAVVADRETMMATAVDNVVRVANSTLEAKLAEGSKELGLRATSFEERVTSINGQLDKMQQLVASLQKEKAQQHGQLVTELRQAALSTKELHDTTNALRSAVASPKSRGQWGERMAEDVLQAAGFRENINFRKQQTLPGGGVPDFTFLLPRELLLHMDVKFPVDNYLRFLEADDDLGRDRARTSFARDVRDRIKELRSRGYIDPETTVDTMLLFIPNESVYAFVHENDADLIDIALKHKVVLCSPLTLFSVLAVVRQSVDNFRLERRSSEILDYLVDFRKEWGKFGDHVDKTDRQLQTFTKSFEELTGRRRNVLDKTLRRIDDFDAAAAVGADLVALERDAAVVVEPPTSMPTRSRTTPAWQDRSAEAS